MMDELELYHHGILGMRWGIRRYQNEDGTRTSLGKKHEQEIDKSSKKLSDNQKTALKAVAVMGAAVALSYGSQKMSSVAKSYIRNNGKDIAISVLKNTPKVLTTASNSFKVAVKLGKSAVTVGKTLTKAGGSVVKISGGIASKAFS